MMKKAILICIISSIVPFLFASILFNRNKKTLPGYERANPTDRKATNYQGFETIDANHDGIPDIALTVTYSVRTNLQITVRGIGPSIIDSMAYTFSGDIDESEYIPFQNSFTVHNALIGDLTLQARFRYKNGKKTPVITKQFFVSNQSPTASFQIISVNWTNKLLVATNSYDPDDTMLWYAWDTNGDGNIDIPYSTTASTNIVFTSLGSNFITLFVKDSFGYSNIVSNICFRTNITPVAQFTITDINWTNKIFNAAVSFDPDGGTLYYAWDLDGNGTADTGFSNSFILYTNWYTSLGTNNVMLYVSDGFATNICTNVCTRIKVVPTASFVIIDSNPTNKQFDASSCFNPDNSISGYAWDFDGNGSIDTSFSTNNILLTFYYQTLGTNNVVLYVTDGFSTNVKTNVCTRTNTAPAASFLISNINSTNIQLDASACYDPDDSITGYAWDLDGNGTLDTLFSISNMIYTALFTNFGFGYAVLYVKDHFTTNMASNICYHTNSPPCAAFTITPSKGSTNSVYEFNARASSDAESNIVLYLWDFNCDGIYDVMVTSNTYATNFTTNTGNYQIVLNVTDTEGAASIFTNEVTVLAIPDGLSFWNTLNNGDDMVNNGFGPHLNFPDQCYYSFVAGVHSNAIGISSTGGSGGLVYFSGAEQVLNAEIGTIEMWVKIADDPEAYTHGAYWLWNGPYNPNAAFGANLYFCDPAFDNQWLAGSVDFNGASVAISYTPTNVRNAHGFLNQWLHVALVWNRTGIGGTSDRLRIYLNGTIVAATNTSTWGTTTSGEVWMGSSIDFADANKLWIDNVKAFRIAKTNFADRFIE
ncbi:MAG: PKD domain-containing protein [Spirochaetes bacterium]|nr:PKD domain-containing protein [Spirochaetota bacterium]